MIILTKFYNEVQAKKFEKEHKVKVKKSEIAMGLSEGNKKLNDTDHVSFYQWNISSVITCPFRTAMCEASCYALKAERMYPTVKTRRMLNYEFSKTEKFVPTMIEQLEYELSRKKNKGKTIFCRIHEAGDFYSAEYMEKWVDITDHFKGNRNIVFMAYTKSLPFVKLMYKKYGKENINIVFKSSIWDDTKEKFHAMTEELGLSVFTACPKGEIEQNGYIACPASDAFKGTKKERTCGDCKMCYLANKNIAIEIH